MRGMRKRGGNRAKKAGSAAAVVCQGTAGKTGQPCVALRARVTRTGGVAAKGQGMGNRVQVGTGVGTTPTRQQRTAECLMATPVE